MAVVVRCAAGVARSTTAALRWLGSAAAGWFWTCGAGFVRPTAQVGCAQEHASLALAPCRLDVLVRLVTTAATVRAEGIVTFGEPWAHVAQAAYFP